MVQPGVIFIGRPPRLLISSFASTRTPRCCPCCPFLLGTSAWVLRSKPVNQPPMVLRPKSPNPFATSVLHMHTPSDTCPAILDRLAAKSSEPRSTCTSSVLTRSTRSLPCTLALIDVSDVSHRSWSPNLLVPQSKPHVRPSPLLVCRRSTSLLDLHLAVNHRL
jgi:hypothetical protein